MAARPGKSLIDGTTMQSRKNSRKAISIPDRASGRSFRNTNGLLQNRVDVVDWDGDGLIDLLVGCERGGILFYPNLGTKQAPRFVYPKFIFTNDGKPLDVGFSSGPLVIDWDG